MKYELSGLLTISVYTTIEADSEKEAIRLGEDLMEIETHQFGDNEQEERAWVVDDFDGEVQQVVIR